MVILVIAGVLVGADFAARAVAEARMASKVEQQAKLTSKPSVGIDGFPFLTQVAAKDFRHVTISGADLSAGPLTVDVDATARGIRLNSYAFSSGVIDSLSGTAFVSFGSMARSLPAQIGPLGALLDGAGLTVSAAGPDTLKASLNLIVVSGSATWRVTRLSGDSLRLQLVGSSGLPAELLGSLQDVAIKLPKLPLGLTIDSVAVSAQGIVGQVSGHHVPFGS